MAKTRTRQAATSVAVKRTSVHKGKAKATKAKGAAVKKSPAKSASLVKKLHSKSTSDSKKGSADKKILSGFVKLSPVEMDGVRTKLFHSSQKRQSNIGSAKAKSTGKSSIPVRKNLRSRGDATPVKLTDVEKTAPRKQILKTVKAGTVKDSSVKKEKTPLQSKKKASSNEDDSDSALYSLSVTRKRKSSEKAVVDTKSPTPVKQRGKVTQVTSSETRISPKAKVVVSKPTAKVLPKTIIRSPPSPKKSGDKSVTSTKLSVITTESTETVSEFTRPSLIRTIATDTNKEHSRIKEPAPLSSSAAKRGKRKRSDDKEDDSDDVVIGYSARGKRLRKEAGLESESAASSAVKPKMAKVSHFTSITDESRSSGDISATEKGVDLMEAGEVEGDSSVAANNVGDSLIESTFLTPSRWDVFGKHSRLFDNLWKSRDVHSSSTKITVASADLSTMKIPVDSQRNEISSGLSYSEQPIASANKLQSVSESTSSRQRNAAEGYSRTEVRNRKDNYAQEVSGAAARLLSGVEVLPVDKAKGGRRWAVSRRRVLKIVLILAASLVMLSLLILLISYLYV